MNWSDRSGWRGRARFVVTTDQGTQLEGELNNCVFKQYVTLFLFLYYIRALLDQLLGQSELRLIFNFVQRINALATIKTASYGTVDVEYVIGVGGYELERFVPELRKPKSSSISVISRRVGSYLSGCGL
jgi:hypothetical protein